jgi:hypothetical protein
MESAAVPAETLPTGAGAGEKGLKSNAIGYASNLVIGIASTVRRGSYTERRKLPPTFGEFWRLRRYPSGQYLDKAEEGRSSY